jgi:hypothetical protein
MCVDCRSWRRRQLVCCEVCMQFLAPVRADLRHGIVRLLYGLQTAELAHEPLRSLRLRWSAPPPIPWRLCVTPSPRTSLRLYRNCSTVRESADMAAGRPVFPEACCLRCEHNVIIVVCPPPAMCGAPGRYRLWSRLAFFFFASMPHPFACWCPGQL